MKNNNVNVLHILTFLIIILSVVATATGLFYTTGGAPFDIINQYGDSVKMYGDGIYARDSFFRVLIFKGTDLTILVVGVPMLAAATLLDLKKKTVKRRILLAFSCLFLLRKREGLGYMLLSILLIICMVMGIMLPVQTVFQVAAGIAIPLPVLITKIGIFVVLAVFAAYFEIRFMRILQQR